MTERNRSDHSDSEEIAERTEGVAAASAFGVDSRSIMEAWATIVEEATTQPRATFEAGQQLGRDIGRIWFGESDISPEPDDSRFRDGAWQDNGFYRRLGQSYTAWTQAMDGWLAELRPRRYRPGSGEFRLECSERFAGTDEYTCR